MGKSFPMSGLVLPASGERFLSIFAIWESATVQKALPFIKREITVTLRQAVQWFSPIRGTMSTESIEAILQQFCKKCGKAEIKQL